MSAKPKAWEKLDGESDSAWEAFQAYRDLMPSMRSRRAAYIVVAGEKAQGKKYPRHWDDWHKKYEWDRRADAFDREQDRIRLRALQKARTASVLRFQTDMVRECENSSLILRTLQGKLAERLKSIDVDEIKDSVLLQLVIALGRQLQTSHDIRAGVLGLEEVVAVIQNGGPIENLNSDALDTDEDG